MPQWKEGRFRTADGLNLFYRYKEPQEPTDNALFFLHRGHEHSARVIPFADKISQNNYWCFAMDLRGHGHSEGDRAWAENFEAWVKDLNSFVGHIRHTFHTNPANSILVANSVGSVIAVSWILNYGPGIKGCILGAPAFSIKLYIPFALGFLKLASKFSDKLFVTSYVRSGLLTRDKDEARAYDDDKLITKKIGVNILITLFSNIKNCFNRLKDFETDVLVITAEKDYIVDNKLHKKFINGISSSTREHIVLANFRHAIFHEKDQQQLITHCQNFIQNRFKDITAHLPAVIPEARSHTVEEHKKLSANPAPVEHIYYSCYRFMLKMAGKLSQGISTGLKYGFDSGLSLDYIYRNQSTGNNILGRIIDRIYLNSVGWRGIRTRKENLKKTLIGTLQLLNKDGIHPIILDIASGPGRYLFETQQEMPFPVSLQLNDNDNNSLQLAKKIAVDYKATDTSFTNHDAFTLDAHIVNSEQLPNVIIVSGLFELYDNNLQVQRAISQLYKTIKTGGYLIYTGQPWHPQIEMIGRVLNNRNGDRWVMRRRIQREMDLLVESTGFRKLNTAADDNGIFTVSCARKC
ncbi:Putative lipase in cluster with Phosphatidate cytidylyltransferase [hydrothermal vent metagenome]|uniref:Lipase in cluster with Phosphatidate cytidylyltransferase n=1 Tax=hydrothermal vent metagenome TaxID=652676 RepID=A0A3B0Y4D7_9ZZZZ